MNRTKLVAESGLPLIHVAGSGKAEVLAFAIVIAESRSRRLACITVA